MKKFLAILICLVTLLSAVGCAWIPENTETDPEVLYKDVISEYTKLLVAQSRGEELPQPKTLGVSERKADISEALYSIVDGITDASIMGYGFKDMDGNGIPELIILSKYYTVYAVFSFSKNAPILLQANGEKGNTIDFATRNRFFMKHHTVNGNTEEITYYTCRVSGDKMVYDSVFGQTYDKTEKKIESFQIADGSRTSIDEETFKDLVYEHQRVGLPAYSDTSRLLAPRIYFPLINRLVNGNAPIADFSSYAAIRETYKKISAGIGEFNSTKWVNGEYDDLFVFPSYLDFEYYNRLLPTLYSDHLGYDELDLNGDGIDELVLMDEAYRIKAIFTQKNGVPVLVDAFADETCWIDSEGFIHVDNEQYYYLEYYLYELTVEGKLDLVYSVHLAENGNRYLIRDGKTERITFDKSMEIYHDDYCRYSAPFVPYEQTRNVTELTYTPLMESSENTVELAKDKTWHKYADLEEVSDKDWERSNTFVTFEKGSDNQMKVNVKYEYIFSYPDPDRENYMLDDITESFLNITGSVENGVLTFADGGIKGKIEFGHEYIWLVITESTDDRFPVGFHCFEEYVPRD